MKRNQESVRAFRTENADGLPEFAREHTQRLRDLEKKIAELEAESLDLAIERSHLLERLKFEPKTIPVETSERREQVDVVDANAAGRQDTAARLNVLRLQIAELRSRGLRDAHPHLNRLLIEQDLLIRSPDQMPNEAPTTALRPSQPTTVPSPPNIADAPTSKRLGSRTPGSPTGNGDSTLVENRPNERRTQMETRLDTLSVRMDQLARQITDTKAQLVKTRSIVVNLPVLESKYAEISRSQTADISTYQQVAMVLEMAEFQLKLEQDSAPSRLEQFNLPRLRFSSMMMKVLISTIVGAMIGFVLTSLIWSLLSLRQLVWPQGITKGVVQNVTGPGSP
jgi:regulator of replication initiation timing